MNKNQKIGLTAGLLGVLLLIVSVVLMFLTVNDSNLLENLNNSFSSLNGSIFGYKRYFSQNLAITSFISALHFLFVTAYFSNKK
jgi:preprotein translocase subunit SecG